MLQYKTWYWAAVVFQLLTSALHSLSFFNDPAPANESERVLFDLMRHYRRDLGGMSVSTEELMTALSACFTLLYLFGGLLNAYLLRRSKDEDLLRGVLKINLLVFGICFVVMAAFTFPPPIVLTGLVAFCLAIAFLRTRFFH